MFKKIILFGISLGSLTAFAGTGQSNFHLLNMKCELEAHDTVETTPQSPPLDVDDPGTPGCNRWEVNVVVSGNLSLSENKYELPLLDINYGIGDNLQLKYEVPNMTSQGEGDSVSIVGSSKAGIKYMFYENEETDLQLAFYPQLEFITPGSKAALRGIETPGNIISLPLLMSMKLGQISTGDVMLTTNVAYDISSKSDTSDSVSLMAGIGVPLSSKISVMGEISTEQAVSKNEDDIRDQLVKVNAGAIFKIFKGVSVFGSLGQSLYSSDDNRHMYFLSGIRI